MTERIIPQCIAIASAFVAIGCASSSQTAAGPAPLPASAPPPVVVTTDAAAIARARADSVQLPYVQADIDFMTGMIGHHAQAIEMSRIAARNKAGAAVLRLAERVINAQMDEIVNMQQWLMDRQKPVPKVDFHGTAGHTDADHAKHMAGGQQMGGMSHEHHMMMPGMLSDAQMKQLQAARGNEFDRLFLTFMIQHHRGAVTMVSQLFATPGAGQNHTVFKLASDVNVDQTTEIARMEQMLAAMKP